MENYQKIRMELLKRYRRCELCGDDRGLEVHHKIPRSLGGSNDKNNLIVLCGKCHAILHNGTRSELTKIGQRRKCMNLPLRMYEHFRQVAVAGNRFDACDVFDYLEEELFPFI